jgi:hypothetical protein
MSPCRPTTACWWWQPRARAGIEFCHPDYRKPHPESTGERGKGLIPKGIRCFQILPVKTAFVREQSFAFLIMFCLEALHPDGWRARGRFRLEYWAQQEARMRCYADGRNYRILEEESGCIVAILDSRSCRSALLNPATGLRARCLPPVSLQPSLPQESAG